MVIKILNKKWKIKVLSHKKYCSTIGSDSAGECHIDIKTIFIHKKNLDITTIVHEMVHAYCSELGIVEMQLDDDQLEEAYAELLARHHEEIIADSKKILKYFKK